MHSLKLNNVLVPFYRGAVVFPVDVAGVKVIDEFSSPFIEERLYLINLLHTEQSKTSSRPLLSRSGCIFKSNNYNLIISQCSRPLLSRSGCIYFTKWNDDSQERFSSPFIEERLYLKSYLNLLMIGNVLVPFYRGAVVFQK